MHSQSSDLLNSLFRFSSQVERAKAVLLIAGKAKVAAKDSAARYDFKLSMG